MSKITNYSCTVYPYVNSGRQSVVKLGHEPVRLMLSLLIRKQWRSIICSANQDHITEVHSSETVVNLSLAQSDNQYGCAVYL